MAVRDEDGKFASNSVIDGDHQAGGSAAPKPKKIRIRTEVAKQAAVSEKRIQACAAIRKQSPDAYQRIVSGQSTIREEKAALNKAHRGRHRQLMLLPD